MRIAIAAVRASVLSALLAGALLPLASAAAAASSVTVVDSPDAATPDSAAATPASPQACAERFHAGFAAIRSGPFAALAAAARSANQGAGETPQAAPREFLFSPASATGAEGTALRNARRWMAAQAGPGPALDRNGRWIAARIREDLGDYLGQGPSPYLCSGVANYLALLERQAAQIRVSPERRERDVETQSVVARNALSAAVAALRPVPAPVWAPADRPGTGMVAAGLPGSPVSEPTAAMGPPMRVAAGETGEETRVSEGRGDPDLPPLRTPSLDAEGDLLGAIDRLAAAIVAAEPLRPAQTEVSATDSITTGSITAPAPGTDRVRRRLETLVPTVSAVPDPRAREAVTQALASIEALDALQHARLGGGDSPFATALDATFAAIRDAHRQACRCTPTPASLD